MDDVRRRILTAPVGTIVRASGLPGQDDHHCVRMPGDHSAATGGWSLRGGRWWEEIVGWDCELSIVSYGLVTGWYAEEVH